MEKEKYEMEFLVNASPKIIYNCLSTPSGLSEWFSDDVNIKSDVFTFLWEGSEEQAKLLTKKRDEFVKFRTSRDKTLKEPQLIYQSIQINVNAGELPKAESNETSYLKIPLFKK